MGRSSAAACALALPALLLLLPVSAQANDPALPMQFTLRREGPAKVCGAHCRLFISASGAITADTPRDFENFAEGRHLAGATVVLDSDGGSVHGAIKLGREMRALKLDTTVGRLTDLPPTGKGRIRRASFSGRASCESMCAFVLLAGVRRSVPLRARVMVHQIWLGDRRADPTAATYSAEDLVLVQRDIGRLAKYTVDMGAAIEVLDLALRIPPWEPMHLMTRAEIRDSRVVTSDNFSPATVALSATQVHTQVNRKQLVATISERRWAVVEHAGRVVLARSQPLTHEGESIGDFDLMVSCGGPDSYDVSYSEHRYAGRRSPLRPLRTVIVNVGDGSAPLKVISSHHDSQAGEIVSYAAGTMPASLMNAFAGIGNHSLTIQTTNGTFVTGIRTGNTGVRQSLPKLAAVCRKGLGERAELTPHRTGGSAEER